ncbi:MAG: RsmD family RNA methyltransferase [Treponema sp.]|nr:RsmD family RNA methyltransferase [Treponema sp.]
MRITGGVLSGRVVQCPKGIIRPAMDKMRESIFAILGQLDGKSFLDLFSGSASISLEAASRGSRDIELCESDKGKVKTILENVSIAENELGVKIQCHFMPVEYFITRCKRKFDYIFFDPPFPYKFHIDLIKKSFKKNILEEDGSILIHRPEELKMPDTIEGFVKTSSKTYGRSIVDFYKHKL